MEDKKTGEGEHYKKDWNWKEKGYADTLSKQKSNIKKTYNKDPRYESWQNWHYTRDFHPVPSILMYNNKDMLEKD